MALSIVFEDQSDFHEIEDLAVAAIFNQCARWEYVKFNRLGLHIASSQEMGRSIWEMPLLVEFHITSYSESEDLLGHFNAPNLRQVNARLSHDLHFLQFFSKESWEQLTTLQMDDIPPAIARTILKQTMNLVHCWLNLWDEPEDEGGPTDQVSLPHLETLLLTSDRTSLINALLRCLVVPSLRILAIQESFLSELSDDPGHPDPVVSLSRVLRTWTLTRPLERLYLLSPALVQPDEYRAAFPEIDPHGLDFDHGPQGDWEPPHDIWGHRWTIGRL
ncbi:hypothetical protein C8F01DRAFT_2295 [Mycena amicta]|nr:hypothetical protein C8F01DRAFT_2295 [Mycena amicta]